ncbi:4-hydroxy-tetrahydrodipicolinate reductase [Alkaliphilus peptidifermentans]|uniref:4-hydroxy-tetrahydrodipicolinate reductase n=1 Tax=Alkaliphilus peptidifermentans DSM 18978 TaxID=1120976 RepID=A0A1G5K8Z8_9FIRM|nr:4-hydroxy-tetrahydrodipicolinate reductase [Alkaliphilus peptidifermentans]SCY96721.1 dihydrodipicolinate reductase [Alkaliphilus peptidifermentans DSM 18978]
MIKVTLNGSNGKMGRVLSKVIHESNEFELVTGISRSISSLNTYSSFDELSEASDVIIDFSHPTQLLPMLNYCKKHHVPVVIATTGYSDEELRIIHEAGAYIPVFYSPNMSLGVNLLLELVSKATVVLEDQFDIEIIERHHNKKIDAPSGTALLIANTINRLLENQKSLVYSRQDKKVARDPSEIGIMCLRGGTIVGEHEVVYIGNDEIIEIKHTALSKEIFAYGALRAAKFIIKQNPGYYGMKDMLKE